MKPSMTLGIDLSRHRKHTYPKDIREIQEHADLGFMFYRVTYGLEPDPTARRFADMAEEEGLVHAGYGWIRPHLDPKQQAEALLAHMPDDTFGIFLDVEEPGLKWWMLLEAVERLRRDFDDVGLYSSEAIKAGFTGDKVDWSIFDLEWLADYRREIGGGRRELASWTEPPRDVEVQAPSHLWQFGLLEWDREDKDKVKDASGNIYHGTQWQLAEELGAIRAVVTR